MNRRSFLGGLAGLPVVVALGCDPPADDVALIRNLGLRAVERAESHDIDGMMELVDEEFRANPGDRPEKDVRPILFVAFRRYGRFRILHPKFSITIDESGRTATMNVPFFVLREGQTFDAADLEGLEDDPIAWAKTIADKLGDPYILEAALTKSTGAWRVQGVSLLGFRSLRDFR